MKKRLLSVLKYIFFLGLGFFLVWWQFNKMTSAQRLQFRESLQNADYWLFIPVFIMAVLVMFVRAARWNLLIEPLGYKPALPNTFYAVASGFMANTFVPRAGEILRCTLLNKCEKIPTNKLIGSVLVERTFDLLCYAIFIAFTILIQIKYVAHFAQQKFSEILFNQHGMAGWLKIIIFLSAVLLLIIFIRWVFKKFAHHRHIITIKGFHIGIKEGFKTIIKLKQRRLFIAHTFFIWALYTLQIYLGFFAISATSHLGIAQACSVLSLATLGMIVSPGGIGAFPLAVQQVLLIYNIDNVSFGWLIWGIATAIIILVGIISFGLLIYKNKKLHEAGQANLSKNI